MEKGIVHYKCNFLGQKHGIFDIDLTENYKNVE